MFSTLDSISSSIHKLWPRTFDKKSLFDDVTIFLSEASDLAFWMNLIAISNCLDSLSKLTHSEYSFQMSFGNWTFSAIVSNRGSNTTYYFGKPFLYTLYKVYNTVVTFW